MIRLKSLTLSGCRSIKGPETISFPERGLIRLTGQDTRTGGSSGAGKSSVLHGIMYALGCADIPATQLRSSLGSDTDLSVALQIEDTDGGAPVSFVKDFLIRRGTNAESSILGYLCVTGHEAVTRTLKGLFAGCDTSLIKAISYRGQDTDSSFLSKNDSERKEFLATVIPQLSKFESMEESSVERVTSLEVEAEGAKRLVASLREAVASVSDSISSIGEVDDVAVSSALAEVVEQRAATSSLLSLQTASLDKIDREVADEYHDRLTELSDQLSSLMKACPPSPDASRLTRIIDLQRDCRSRLSRLRDDDQRRRAMSDAEVSKICVEIARLDGEIEKIPVAETAVQKCRTDLAVVVANACPTCRRQWTESQDEATRLEARIADLSVELDRLRGLVGRRASLQTHLDAVPLFEPSPTITALEKSLAQLETEESTEREKGLEVVSRWRSENAARVAELSSSKDRILRQMDEDRISRRDACSKNMSGLSALLDTLREEEVGLVRRRTVIETNKKALDRLNISLREAQDKLAAASSEVDRIEIALRAERDLVALVGRSGFLGFIFDEILREISDETNRILSRVPNTTTTTIVMSSDKVSKNGKVKKNITATANINGVQMDLRTGPSGGQKSMIRLAVDIAIMTVVERRAGLHIGWLLLDEPFNGLGAIEKEAVMEVLREVARNKMVLVIDHATESRDAFDSVIELEYDGTVTRLKGSEV